MLRLSALGLRRDPHRYVKQIHHGELENGEKERPSAFPKIMHRGSFLSATFSLLPGVAPAEFDADFVQPRFQCAVEFAIRGGQGVDQLLDAACAKND